jgi:hypothetical protein
MIKNIFLLSITLITVCINPKNIEAQKANVFNAKFYNVKEFEPPFEMGKGFNINNVFESKLYCFKNETTKIKPKNGSGTGKVSQVGIYYTKTEQEFENLQNSSFSTDVSFFNLFSFGMKDEMKTGSRTTENRERIIFKVNVDFGNFTLATNPVLNSEASALIKQKKFNTFIERYGTHYISECHKESSILVILTKKTRIDEQYSSNQTSFDVGGSFLKVGADMNITNNEAEKRRIEQYNFELDFKFNGPEFDISNLKDNINSILKPISFRDRMQGKTKLDKIKEYLGTFITENVAKELNDPDKSIKTQYYYTPFTLFGLEGIIWTDKKIDKLIEINKTVINLINEKHVIESEINRFNSRNFTSLKAKEIYNDLKEIQELQRNTLNKLETIYETCASVTCKIENNCCLLNSVLSDLDLIKTKKNDVSQKRDLLKEVSQNNNNLSINNDNVTTDKLKYYFGKIKQGVPQNHIFSLKNVGEKPLIIQQAISECSCVTAEYSRAPTPMGRSTIVKIIFNAAKLGSFTKTINIRFIGVEEPIVLTIEGEVL